MNDVSSRTVTVFESARKVIGATPGELGRSWDDSYRKVVWTGIVMENLPDICYAEVTERAGMSGTRHSSTHDWFAKWKEFPWRVRHGWLMMAESASAAKGAWSPYVWHDELNRMCNESFEGHRGFNRVTR